nr:nucleoporin-62 C-terminal-like protein [Camelus dromedarius]
MSVCLQKDFGKAPHVRFGPSDIRSASIPCLLTRSTPFKPRSQLATLHRGRAHCGGRFLSRPNWPLPTSLAAPQSQRPADLFRGLTASGGAATKIGQLISQFRSSGGGRVGSGTWGSGEFAAVLCSLRTPPFRADRNTCSGYVWARRLSACQSYAWLPLPGTPRELVPGFSLLGVEKRRRAAGLQLLDNRSVCTSPRGLASASTFAATASSGAMLFTSFSNASTSTAATGFSFGAPSTLAGVFGGTASGFGLKFPGIGGAVSTASTTSTTTTTTNTTTTTTTTTSDFTFNLKPVTSTGISNTVPVGITPVPFTSTVDAIVTPVMTYGQLDALVNNWSLELEDQEKHFLHQATQINTWDHILIENGEKITALHGEVEKVKLNQKRLEQELDFILSQQKELEDLLIPLEGSVKGESGSAYPQHTDEEHERTYNVAENIDAQLKRMAQDFKDIIEHLNTFGNPADPTDPLQQICKILNVQADSLQWINQTSDMLQRKVEEVTEVFEHRRRKEQERNVVIAFD